LRSKNGSVALKGITQPVSIFNVLDQAAAGSAQVIPLQRPGQHPRQGRIGCGQRQRRPNLLPAPYAAL
jgi:hypothetical protein